ncbi:hypothetical protein C8F04DRAFT_1193579 [Mycena alexandri]|uniref:Uncharacterized protein n=1 Tax=Mycena alexandri TaxID=1745969 RepID=A0AAD6S8V2_9AGAR|nr:hypothetical protein C8F04DRAFT_1193579 [Mycena alexandri]
MRGTKPVGRGGAPGMVSLRSSRFFDTHIGAEGKDPASSQIIGDRGILISDDGERRTERLDNPTGSPWPKTTAIYQIPAKWTLSQGGPLDSKKRKGYASSVSIDSHLGRSMSEFRKFNKPSSKRPCGCMVWGILARTEVRLVSIDAAALSGGMERGLLDSDHAQGHRFNLPMGHEGRRCKFPQPFVRSLTVIDTTGVHEIKYQFFPSERLVSRFVHGSRYLRDIQGAGHIRLLNVVANVNACDFVTALERLTNATTKTGLRWMPDRYKAFLMMTRQWAFLQRLRCTARCHDPEGIVATKPGECMVNCWGCPFHGRNTPSDWRSIDPKYRYLFRLILAMDANFKMKNRIHAREHDDPSLGPGLGAFVEPEEYKKHLGKYVAEKDISTCIAFAALTQKDTRNTTGLRVSGVGGVVCARHECVRPNGLGDLQKGERYANMDYILMSLALEFRRARAHCLIRTSHVNGRRIWRNAWADCPRTCSSIWTPSDIDTGLPVWHAWLTRSYAQRSTASTIFQGWDAVTERRSRGCGLGLTGVLIKRRKWAWGIGQTPSKTSWTPTTSSRT